MTYDTNTGFRNGSLAQRSPGGYFLMLGAIYSAIWFGLSFLGHHHHRSAGVIVATAIICLVFGAIFAAMHYGIWRWRSNRRGVIS